MLFFKRHGVNWDREFIDLLTTNGEYTLSKKRLRYFPKLTNVDVNDVMSNPLQILQNEFSKRMHSVPSLLKTKYKEIAIEKHHIFPIENSDINPVDISSYLAIRDVPNLSYEDLLLNHYDKKIHIVWHEILNPLIVNENSKKSRKEKIIEWIDDVLYENITQNRGFVEKSISKLKIQNSSASNKLEMNDEKHENEKSALTVLSKLDWSIDNYLPHITFNQNVDKFLQSYSGGAMYYCSATGLRDSVISDFFASREEGEVETLYVKLNSPFLLVDMASDLRGDPQQDCPTILKNLVLIENPWFDCIRKIMVLKLNLEKLLESGLIEGNCKNVEVRFFKNRAPFKYFGFKDENTGYISINAFGIPGMYSQLSFKLEDRVANEIIQKEISSTNDKKHVINNLGNGKKFIEEIELEIIKYFACSWVVNHSKEKGKDAISELTKHFRLSKNGETIKGDASEHSFLDQIYSSVHKKHEKFNKRTVIEFFNRVLHACKIYNENKQSENDIFLKVLKCFYE